MPEYRLNENTSMPGTPSMPGTVFAHMLQVQICLHGCPHHPCHCMSLNVPKTTFTHSRIYPLYMATCLALHPCLALYLPTCWVCSPGHIPCTHGRELGSTYALRIAKTCIPSASSHMHMFAASITHFDTFEFQRPDNMPDASFRHPVGHAHLQ
jgi:hypothetical protein